MTTGNSLKWRPMVCLFARRSSPPDRSNSLYVADGAQIIGDVVLGSDVSVWFNAVLSATPSGSPSGPGSNVQDGAFFMPILASLHGRDRRRDRARRDPPRLPDRATTALIGMGAIILNGASIASGSIVAAGAVVPEGKEFPPRSLIMGVPAKVVSGNHRTRSRADRRRRSPLPGTRAALSAELSEDSERPVTDTTIRRSDDLLLSAGGQVVVVQPISRRISSVCSPSSGGMRCTSPGVSLNLTGSPSRETVPKSGCAGRRPSRGAASGGDPARRPSRRPVRPECRLR